MNRVVKLFRALRHNARQLWRKYQLKIELLKGWVQYRYLRILSFVYVVAIIPVVIPIYIRLISTEAANPSAIRDDILSLGAMVGAPFVVWRTLIAWKESLSNERTRVDEIVARAIDQLNAQTQSMTKDGTLNKPDLSKRVAAILALERVALASFEDFLRVCELLTHYIKSNSPQPVPAPRFEGEDIWDEPTTHIAARYSQDCNEFLSNIPDPRVDIQTAVDVLGRRGAWYAREQKRLKFWIDLSGTNLQRVKFSHWFSHNDDPRTSLLSGSDFSWAQLDGATFTEVDLSGAEFTGASMIGARLVGVRLKNTIIHIANISDCDFSLSDVNGCDIQGCCGIGVKFEEITGKIGILSSNLAFADFLNSDIGNSVIYNCNLASSDLTRVKLQNATVRNCYLLDAQIFETDFTQPHQTWGDSQNDFSRSFGDSTTRIPGDARPVGWPEQELEWPQRQKIKDDLKTKYFGDVVD